MNTMGETDRFKKGLLLGLVIGILIGVLAYLVADTFDRGTTAPAETLPELTLTPDVETEILDVEEKVFETPHKSVPGTESTWAGVLEELEVDCDFWPAFLVDFYETDAGVLSVIGCGQGAYNTSSVVVYSTTLSLDTGIPEYRVLRFYEPPYETWEIYGVNLSYDEATQIFATYTKGRGIADCGSRGVYSFQNEEEDPELVEFYHKEECDGNMDEWPQVYP